MDFPDEDSSWDLFSKKAFGRGGRSLELEEIGKKIAQSCRGLPLAIVVIGGLLANSDMTKAYWQFVAENVSSFANSENDENCLKILSLSYNNMPIYLKSCFLYMALYPEDEAVIVSELIQEWIAEGFVKPVSNKTLEEAALEYFRDLIDRSLIKVLERGIRGNIEHCGIHDLLRDLCIRESRKEHLFIRVPRKQTTSFIYSAKHCFLCGKHSNSDENVLLRLSEVDLFCLPSKSVVRSLVCDPCRTKYQQLMRLRFVRLIGKPHNKVPMEVAHSTKSRYVQIVYHSIKSVNHWSMKTLWNMKIVHVKRIEMGGSIFSEIWNMPQLRHINFEEVEFSDPATNDYTVLENLQTLSNVSYFRCTEEVVRRIPNLKKLGLTYVITQSTNSLHYCLYNLRLLQKLESISLRCDARFDHLDMEYVNFPHSLNTLSLSGCKVSWEDINNRVGLLANLEVLKLKKDSVVGDEWVPIVGQFSRLKYLRMSGLELAWWYADETNFPLLETLSLKELHQLEQIPSCFGDIATLQSIELDDVRQTLIDLAKKIIDEQQSCGNESLRLYVGKGYGSYEYGGVSTQ